MFQQLVGDISALLAQMSRCPAEVDGVPMDDGADHQVETGSSEGLAVKGAITDLAALMEKDGAFELVSGLALVEPGLATPTQCRAGIPLDHEQGAFDAAEFAQGFGEIAGLMKQRTF